MTVYVVARYELAGGTLPAGAKVAGTGDGSLEFEAWRNSVADEVVFVQLPQSEVPSALTTGVIDAYVTTSRESANSVIAAMSAGYIYDSSGALVFVADPGGPTPVDAPDHVIHVALLYEAGLAREADEGGLNFWIDQHEAGMNLLTLAGLLLDSEEFTQRFGVDDAMTAEQFVNVMYMNVLDRPGETAGVEYWVGQMNSGASREAVLLNFAISAENVQASTVGSLQEAEPGYWVFG